MKPNRSLIIVTGAFLLALLGQPLSAATFNIGNGDVPGLRAAIAAANTNNQDDTINLASGGGYYIPDVNNTTGGANGLPIIDRDASGGAGHSLTINGNGATLARSFATGTAVFRILYISNGVAGNQHTTTISNLILTNGFIPGSMPGDGDGGAIHVEQGQLTLNNCSLTDNFAAQRGGAIFTHSATVTLNNCTLSSNEAHVRGGAICNFAQVLVLTNCTLNGNSTVTGPGGAIDNTSGSGSTQAVTLTNCTLSGNFSTDSNGDAISNLTFTGVGSGAVELTLSSCTFDGNDIVNSYVYTGGAPTHATVTLSNTLLFNSPLTNNFNPGTTTTKIISNGYNLSDDDGGGFLTNSGDQINVDPKLDPAGVKNNGGAAPTIALLNGSPAIDHGKSFGVTTDERGLSRPLDLAGFGNAAGGDGSDIGAYETRDPIQSGAVYTVNSTADHDDGVCGAIDCTLREAIAVTNAASGANVINITATGTVVLGASGQLAVTDSTTINGPGARQLAISGNATSRVFNFSNGTSVLSGVTIENGIVQGNGIFLTAIGGGLTNAAGVLTLNDCAIVANRAAGSTGAAGANSGGTASGGGINNTFNGSLTLNRCTFASNLALGGAGGVNSGAGTHGGDGGTGQGGAIYNDSGCSLTMTDCTLAGNEATGGAGGNDGSFAGGNGGTGQGAAIYNRGTLNLVSCTITPNTATGGNGGTGSSQINHGAGGSSNGGGLSNGGGAASVATSIIAGNIAIGGGKDVDGAFTSGGYNLVGTTDHSSGLTAAGDRTGTDASPLNAQVGLLDNYGGDTDTVSLNASSPAIDHGNDAIAPHRDQRNYLRTGLSDIGAFEYNASLLRLVRVARSGFAFQVFIEVVQGKTYGLQRKQVLTASQWDPVIGSGTIATGNDTEFVADPNAFSSATAAFYEAVAQ